MAGEAHLTWHAHPDVWLLISVLVAGYAVAVRRLGPSRAPLGEPPVTRKQVGCYASGVAILWFAADWPMHELSEDFLFSVHMVQHTLFSLVAPPLILLGLPSWLLRTLVGGDRALRVVRFFTRPLIAFAAFNGVVLVTHWPVVVNASLRSEPLHFAVHLALVLTAFAMWWPVVEPLPETARLSEPGKMLYLFLQSVLPTVPASFLTFAERPIYSFYESVPRLIDLSVVDDQQIAGLIMKIGGGLLLWIVIAVLFFRWSSREERTGATELTWDDFERDLVAWDLRK